VPSYCARSDVYATGLPPEAFARPPRPVEGVTPSSGILALRAHGLATDAPITLSVTSTSIPGGTTAALPAGLAVATQYYARPVGSDLLAVATAVSPAAPVASFGDAGVGLFSIIVDHGLYLDAAIVAASLVIDQFARDHATPINGAIVPLLCSFLAARIYVATHRALIPEQKAGEAEAPSWIRSLLDKLFNLYLTGAPILGTTDATPDVQEAGAALIRLRRGDFDLISCDGMGLDIA